MARLKKTVALVGLMGAGKTSVGQIVARRLRAPFLDSDREIEEAAAMTVAEIFARDGEPFFRAREAEVLTRLMEGPPAVLSTGGGAYLSAENRATIAARGVAVWLRADLELLWSRVRHKSTRPLLMTGDPKDTLARLHRERTPAYAQAQIVVDGAPHLSLDQMASRVIEALDDAAEGVLDDP
ncbi:MAG: shikimate kinase [Pseudomonadota bacterium]